MLRLQRLVLEGSKKPVLSMYSADDPACGISSMDIESKLV